MFRKLLLCLCILLIPLMVVKAQEDAPEGPAGLFVFCLYNCQPADKCTVVCYNAYSGKFVNSGYTGPDGGNNNYPPYFNKARFRAAELGGPGDSIPYGEYALYGFYAKKLIGSYWMYSDWSRLMKYPNQYYWDQTDVSLTRFDPPDIKDLLQAVPKE